MSGIRRISKIFQKEKKVLSLYVTAGYPQLNDAVQIVQALSQEEIDIIELGVPYSDPVADGVTIQKANAKALANGINLENVFLQVKEIRAHSDIPLVLMGHFNPVLQYGFERFCRDCESTGVDGTILPDLPPEVYVREYRALYQAHNLANILLVTPQTSEERVKYIDTYSSGFLYAVSSQAITGGSLDIEESTLAYLKRLKSLKLKNPLVVGFGIDGKNKFDMITSIADGGIIASEFIRRLGDSDDIVGTSRAFAKEVRGTL